MTDNSELRTSLEALSWGDLKRTAKQSYGFNPAREMTRDQIISKILLLASDDSRIKAVVDLDAPPKPGFARIRIHKHNRAGGDDPVQISVNGKEITILRDKAVDIPHKFVNALKNAINDLMFPNGYTMDSDKAEIYEDIAEEERDYSFDMIASSPGPDPWPTSLEKTLHNRWKRRKEDAKQHHEAWLTDSRWRTATGRPAYQG